MGHGRTAAHPGGRGRPSLQRHGWQGWTPTPAMEPADRRKPSAVKSWPPSSQNVAAILEKTPTIQRAPWTSQRFLPGAWGVRWPAPTPAQLPDRWRPDLMCPPPAPEAPPLSLGFSTCTVRPPGGQGHPGNTHPPISPQEASGPWLQTLQDKRRPGPPQGVSQTAPRPAPQLPLFFGWKRPRRFVGPVPEAPSLACRSCLGFPSPWGPLSPRDHAHTLPIHARPCHHLPSGTACQPPLHGGGTGAASSQATRPRSCELSKIPESKPRPPQPPTPTRPLFPIPPSQVDELLSNKTKTLKAWHCPLQSQVPWETQRGRQGPGHPAPPPGDPLQSPSSYPVLWEGNSATAAQGASLRGWSG